MMQSDTEADSQPFRERIYRRNFVYFLTDSILFTLAMSIIGPTTVIPDYSDYTSHKLNRDKVY